MLARIFSRPPKCFLSCTGIINDTIVQLTATLVKSVAISKSHLPKDNRTCFQIMTERSIILNNFSNYNFDPKSSNHDRDRAATTQQTLLDVSWRTPQNTRYVVRQHQNKTILEKNFILNVRKCIATIQTYIWTFVIIAQRIWKWLVFLFGTPTKKWIKYQSIHYHHTRNHQLSPLSSHILRYV